MNDRPAQKSRVRRFLDKLDDADRSEFEQVLREHLELKLRTIEHARRLGERANLLQDQPNKYGEGYVAELAAIVGVSTDRLYAFGRMAREIPRERLTSFLDAARSEGFEPRQGHLEEISRLKQERGPDGRPLQESVLDEVCRRRMKVKALRKQVDRLLGKDPASPKVSPPPAPQPPPARAPAVATPSPVGPVASTPVVMPYDFKPNGRPAPPRPPKAADALAADVDRLLLGHSDLQARASELQRQIPGFDRGVARRCMDLVGVKLRALERSNQATADLLTHLLVELANKAGPAVLPESCDEIVAPAQGSCPPGTLREAGDA